MATLLSEGDFRGDINVAGTEQTAVCEELCRFIARYEPDFMEKVLGYDLSKAFYEGAAEEDHDQRWTDLWEGVEWVHNDRNQRWRGLKFCAARYVYFYYMRYLMSLTTTAGEKIAAADNATSADVNHKAINAWNDMSREVRHLWEYLRYGMTDGELTFSEWDNGRGVYAPSLRPINQFGI